MLLARLYNSSATPTANLVGAAATNTVFTATATPVAPAATRLSRGLSNTGRQQEQANFPPVPREPCHRLMNIAAVCRFVTGVGAEG